MLRVIFDSSVYGWLIKEEKIKKIKQKILNDSDFIIYGFNLIRKELRKTPKTIKIEHLSLRILILNLYDELIKGRFLEDSDRIEPLARKFYKEYRQFGGIRSWKVIGSDFIIVASACLNDLDVLVSGDSRTMMSKVAKKAYDSVCLKGRLNVPYFWKYSDLKNKFGF